MARDPFDEWDGVGRAREIREALGARGVVVFAFGNAGRFTYAWAGADDADQTAMRLFAENVGRLVEGESPRDRGEVGPDPQPGTPAGDGAVRVYCSGCGKPANIIVPCRTMICAVCGASTPVPGRQ